MPSLRGLTPKGKSVEWSIARESLRNYSYIVPGYRPAKHHIRIMTALQDAVEGDCKRIMLCCPPGSAKSTYVSKVFPSWYLGRNPDHHVIGGSHTIRLAEGFSRDVKDIVRSDTYQQVFDTRVRQDLKAAGMWGTVQGGKYCAAGTGVGIVGFRAHLGILDDPIKGRVEAYSATDREKTWKWYLTEFWTRMDPRGMIVLIMQRWHEDDLAGRLLKDMARGGEQWEVLSFPMLAEDNDVLGRRPGERLWPEHYTEALVNQAKRDTRTWQALYQQQPRPIEGGDLKREWIQYYREMPTPREVNTYIVVDPANSKKKTSDYTCMMVLGATKDGNILVLDMIRDRLSLTERGDRLFDLHQEWKPLEVAYEQYGMQADIDYLKDRMEREQYRFRISSVGGKLKKEDRISRLAPLFEQGRIYLPKECNRRGSDGIVYDLVHYFVEDEYLQFQTGGYSDGHDDMLDALSRVEDINVKYPSGSKIVNMNLGMGGQRWMG